MLKKKSQGLSLNVIIIAALGLIVLVILAALFMNKTKQFSSGLDSCTSKQGQCLDKCTENMATISAKCPEKGPQNCCISVLS